MIILPSLEIVPAKYDGSTLLSQIPIDGTGDFTVSRTTSPVTGLSTRVNSLGLIETVADNVPRLDYPLGGAVNGCPALLVEPAATNLVPSGTNVGGDAGLSRTATTTSPAVDISGTIIAKAVTGTTTLYASQTCLTSLPLGSTTYTISRFFKYNGTDLTTSLENNNSAQWGGTSWIQRVVISAASGVTLGASTACTGSVENYGNGWYRVSARFTTGATPSGSTTVNYLMLVSGSVASGSSFFTALPQLEVGSVATSYIPTTTGSVTRNADVVSDTTASGVIGQTEGTIYAEVDIRNAFAGTFISLDIGSTADFLIIGRTSSFAVIVQIKKSSGSTVTIITSSSVALGVHKIALGYTNGDYALYIDGVSAGTSTNSTDYPSAALTRCNLAVTAYNVFNDRIRAAAIYPNRLTNAQLALLTSPYTSYSSMASALSYTLG